LHKKYECVLLLDGLAGHVLHQQVHAATHGKSHGEIKRNIREPDWLLHTAKLYTVAFYLIPIFLHYY